MARGARPASYGLVLSKVLPHIDPSRYEVPKAKSQSAKSCCRRPPPLACFPSRRVMSTLESET